MSSKKLRRQIAWEAARLMYSREVSEYYTAKQKAARRIYKGWIKPADLPSNAEIREQVMYFTRLSEGAEGVSQRLLEMRLRAAWWLRKLSPFHPKLIGSVLKGSIREGSDIDIHVFAANVHSITIVLDDLGVAYDLERKRIRKDGEARVFTHLHVKDRFPIELTVYAPSLMGFRFRCSITGKPIDRAGLNELERLIAIEHAVEPREQVSRMADMDTCPDRANVFLSLLMPLEKVKQNLRWHPEGDALFHSMQVYALAKEAMPYDEEFLLAALLHDVGKAIDPSDHVSAGLEALEGFITPRTSWLIAHHMDVHKIIDHSIGARHRKRLTAHPLYEDLLLLGECDRHGRVPGAEVEEPEEALDYIEQIEEMFS
ncbi:HD domain-containing protein [Rhodopirellula sp. SWK7]|uniref:HD domain-containing protein n=1 Tax=Rhodopirellula sp. SWK7 TaxID=595460 RepID=UPI0002BDA7A2|nr:HD domain-containing protein [Rhodopirellula sp. SWK7]EMI40422.1 Metal-dependent phosphohydrolase, HD region, subdomain protein domain protein [Rhodopirellula sp. SWK7]